MPGSISLLSALAAAHAPLAAGHGYLFEPKSRNLVKSLVDNEDCKHCGQGGGPKNVAERGNNAWPNHHAYGSHGVCGDPFQGDPNTAFEDEPYLNFVTEPQTTWTAGQVAAIAVTIEAHHQGHFEFRLCTRQIDASWSGPEEAQKCLDEHVLERVDPDEYWGDCQPNDQRGDCQPLDDNFPGRWYAPTAPKVFQAGPDWTDDMISNLGNSPSNTFIMHYRVPAGISCEKCTLQWYWSSGNTCLYDKYYLDYLTKVTALGWSDIAPWNFLWGPWATEDGTVCKKNGKFAEEFWNCADLRIIPGGPSPPSPVSPSPSVPEPEPEPEPEQDGQCEWWCEPPPEEWERKCDWTGCGGCDPCPKECEWWCAPPPAPWARKCGWVGCRQCGQCAGVTPTPSTPPSPVPPPPTPSTPTPSPPIEGSDDDAFACRQACEADTGSWDGSFTAYEGNEDFCSCGHGGGCPWICSGGGPGTDGGNCDKSACSDDQYHFENDVWDIAVTREQAENAVPYRAFAYVPFCQNGQAIEACRSEFTFAFAFRTTDIAKWRGYVKLLFWTDGFNFLGLLPPTAAGNRNSDDYLLIAYPGDDYPNGWTGDVVIQDGEWYSAKITVNGANTKINVKGPDVDKEWTNDRFGVNPPGDKGPQIGVYSFDFGGTISTDEFHLELAALVGPGGSLERHDCQYQCLADS